MGSTQDPLQWAASLSLLGFNAVGAWRLPLTLSIAEVKEKVELYLLLSGPSMCFLGCILFYSVEDTVPIHYKKEQLQIL